jgi:dipeptidyl aminopeptidase/acylaminoacyl peptidase
MQLIRADGLRSGRLTFAGLAFAGLISAMPAEETGAGAVPILPLETFFDNQSISQATLSPDGTMVAMIAPNSGRYSIAVLDTKTGQVSVPAHFKDENINTVFWKGNDRLLFTSAIDGHEIPLLASINLKGKSYKRILEPRRTKDDFSIFFGNFVDRYVASDDHILITGYTAESDATKVNPSIPRNVTPTVYKVNVNTGRRAQVVGLDRGYAAGWFDREDNQRLTTLTEGKEVRFSIRDRNDQPWRVIKTFDVTDVRWDVRGLLADGRTVCLIDTTTEDRGVLRTLDLNTGQLGAPVFAPPEGEITGTIFSPKRDRLLGVNYEGVKGHTHWFDPRWKGIAQAIEAQFPQHSVAITSMSYDEKRFIFRIYSDRDPGQYLLGDLTGEGLRVQMITAARPAVKPELMSAMQPVKFPARDGLEIHGYLTKPLRSSERLPPLLVMPHGGPFGIRDSWGYNREVQFLANRGYAVLQVNYRGSGGYGRTFEFAGYQEWGGKMQNDLTDAVRWVGAQGLADPERIGIMGASYGGYATLVGVTMTPELYKVGINYVGVSDLRQITRYDLRTDAASNAYFEKAVGRDAALLAARSPVDHVEKIRVPTLHAYGRNDPRVEFVHWELLEKALKKHGKTYEILIEDKEGHGFEKEQTAYKYYSAVEAFLAKYLPPEPLGNVKVGPLKVIEMPAKSD